MKLKTNDKVLIISGKNRGKTGKILKIYRKPQKITVEKINIRTRHIKKSNTKRGERIHYEAPFDASNVKLICPNCNKAVRIGYQKGEDGKKRRICKKCQKLLPDISQAVKKTSSKK